MFIWVGPCHGCDSYSSVACIRDVLDVLGIVPASPNATSTLAGIRRAMLSALEAHGAATTDPLVHKLRINHCVRTGKDAQGALDGRKADAGGAVSRDDLMKLAQLVYQQL